MALLVYLLVHHRLLSVELEHQLRSRRYGLPVVNFINLLTLSFTHTYICTCKCSSAAFLNRQVVEKIQNNVLMVQFKSKMDISST
jgi:hypothetical protein